MTPTFTYLDPSELAAAKAELQSGAPSALEAMQRLRHEADRLLRLEPQSVMDKTTVAASGDPHDFYAIGGYSWPNPATGDGLPYIYRDSETNPEATDSSKFDKGPYEETTRRVAVLALAYYYSGERVYAAHATTLLRTWFIHSATRMNPNFRYAAARPGVWDGHFSGTIEGVFLIEMLDYVALLEDSPEWNEDDDRQLRKWFLELSDWLAGSSFGRREVFTTNNHGSYLLAQVIVFSTYAGHQDRARKAIRLARGQLRRQIEKDGSMPREIDRADGWFYSVYGLRAFVVIARAAERYGVDLWSDRSAAISASAISLGQYISGKTEWPFSRQHKPWEHDAAQLFHVAGRAYRSPDLIGVAIEIAEGAPDEMPYARLQGLTSAVATSPDLDLPLPKAWREGLTHAQSFKIRLDDAGCRFLGVLASRGLWAGRRLR